MINETTPTGDPQPAAGENTFYEKAETVCACCRQVLGLHGPKNECPLPYPWNPYGVYEGAPSPAPAGEPWQRFTEFWNKKGGDIRKRYGLPLTARAKLKSTLWEAWQAAIAPASPAPVQAPAAVPLGEEVGAVVPVDLIRSDSGLCLVIGDLRIAGVKPEGNREALAMWEVKVGTLRAALAGAPSAGRPMTWTALEALNGVSLIDIMLDTARAKGFADRVSAFMLDTFAKAIRSHFAAAALASKPETSASESGEALAEPAPTESVCRYTPTGWEHYPRKEWATDCGLKVVHDVEAWDGEKYAPVGHGERCMKCKRKPIDASPPTPEPASGDTAPTESPFSGQHRAAPPQDHPLRGVWDDAAAITRITNGDALMLANRILDAVGAPIREAKADPAQAPNQGENSHA